MPELTLTEVPRPLREQYQKGMAAYQKDNLDYAIAIFTPLLEQEPGFYPCREALRATQIKKARKKSGFFKKVLGTASSSGLLAKAQVLARTRAKDALPVAEKILNQDPENYQAHKVLADAALASGFPMTAVLSMEIVVKANPTDKKSAIKLAKALTAAGNINRAQKIYDELVNLYPADTELLQAAKDIAANKTLTQGGYNKLESGQGSYRDVLKDEAEAIELEQQNREVKDTETAGRLLEQYVARLEEEPGNARLIRTIADLCADQRQYQEAIEYYKKLMELEEGEPVLEKRIAELQERLFNQRMENLNPSSADYDDQLAELQKERDQYILEECQARAERYPNDLSIRFELGEIYFAREDFSAAIKQFQKAQHNPHKKVKSLSRLGQCFSRRGMHDLAARSLQGAVAAKEVFDGEKKEMIYELGCVYEKMGDPDRAIEEFKKIYEVDIEYRDVSDKVDSYYDSRQGSAAS